jgi:enamine deaminase RidA (YjgF/YER057c/UK114 family)
LEGVRSIGQESARHAAQGAAEEVGAGPPVSVTSPEFATRKYADAVMRPVEFQGGSVREIGVKDRLVYRVRIRRSFFLENLLMLTLQPAEWSKPRGFSHGVAVDGPGRWIVLAGQTGGDEKGEYQPDMAAQVGMALRRIVKLLAEAGAGPEHIVRLTWYLINRSDTKPPVPVSVRPGARRSGEISRLRRCSTSQAWSTNVRRSRSKLPHSYRL